MGWYCDVTAWLYKPSVVHVFSDDGEEQDYLPERTCEWLPEHSGNAYDKWRCSECDFLFIENRTDGGATGLEPNYCPNCGARVKEEE